MRNVPRILSGLAIASLLAGAACQPASDIPAETPPAESSEPPPPPPLPTEAAADTPAGTDEVPVAADSPVAQAPPPVPDSVTSPAPGATPVPPPPAPRTAECRAPPPPAAPGQQRLRVFFSCGEQVRPVERALAPTRAVLRAALEQLLRGPTAEERAAGFHSFFGAATAGALRSVVVRDGVARIDFADFSRAIPNASSSAGSAQLLAQLRATIFQYAAVRGAEITFDGSCDAFWNWLQRGCQPLRRDGN